MSIGCYCGKTSTSKSFEANFRARMININNILCTVLMSVSQITDITIVIQF